MLQNTPQVIIYILIIIFFLITTEPCLQLLDHTIRPEDRVLPTAEEEPRIEWVPESDMSKRNEWKKLGRGAFTVVYRGEIYKRGRNWFPVALKCPRDKASQTVKDVSSCFLSALL